MKRIVSILFVTLIVLSLFNIAPIQVYAITSADLSISENGIAFICKYEGFSATCYHDNTQQSIGYGSKCGDGTLHAEGKHTITKSAALQLMINKIESEYSPHVRWATKGLQMNQNQFDALCSQCYNTWQVEKSPLVKYLKGEIDEATARSQTAEFRINKGTSDENGLRNRRIAEANLFFSGSSISYNPDDHTYPSRNIGYYNGTAMTGDDVMWVQCVLYQLGYLSKSGVDGSFGPNSKKAVASFQSDNGLSSDGSCGQITRAKLKECWEEKKYGATKITFSSDTVNLGLTNNNSQTITGKISGRFSHWQNDWDGDIVGIERTENDGEFEWRITARAAGTTDMILIAQDENYDTIVEKRLRITVADDATRITFSSDTVSLGLTSNRTQTVTGKIIGDFSHWQNDWDGDIVGIERTENDGEFEWKITARTAGTTDMILIAQDDNYDTIVEKRLRITVGLNTSDIAAFSFDANGGDFDTSSINVNYEGAIEIPYSVPIKRGYQFVGWTARRNNDNTWATEGYGWLTDSELASQEIDKQLFANGSSYRFDDSWTSELSTISSYTFYAVWKASTLYDFEYDATGGSFDVSSASVYYGDGIVITNSIPIKQGYKFVGWNAKRDIDSTWATVGYGWLTDSELASQGIEKQLFAAGSSYRFDDSWLNGASEISSYIFYAVWEPDTTVDIPYKLIIESKDAIITNTAIDTITVSLTLDNFPNIKSFALSQLRYDTDVLELVDFKWETDGVLRSWNGSQAALTKEADTDMNGRIISLTFKVKEGVTEYIDDYSVSCRFTARQADGTVVQVAVVPGVISIKNVMRGDLDRNNIVNEDDAIYLLYSTFFEEDYPLNQDCDFDKNGKIDEDDAIYLLYYTFFPEDYPIN